jgi:shikimate kinase
MKYFICGFMGAGKSTALKKISEKEKWFGYSFVDLDLKIFEKYGDGFVDLGALISNKGFEWFREIEKVELVEALSLTNVWIALGGGALDDTALEILNNKANVKGYFLDTSLDECLRRISNDKSNRPLGRLSDEELKVLYRQRKKNYSRFEPLVIL